MLAIKKVNNFKNVSYELFNLNKILPKTLKLFKKIHNNQKKYLLLFTFKVITLNIMTQCSSIVISFY